MKVHQPKLPLDLRKAGSVVFMCLNADCFYCETIMDVNDLVWKEVWSSEIHDLTSVPHCPSCGEVAWREFDGIESRDYDKHPEDYV